MQTVAIVPALNEACNLPQVLAELREHAAGWVDETIVVDGGSIDGTLKAAARAGARAVVETRRGYGRALAAGIAAAPGAAAFVFLDADGSDDPADLPRLIEPVRDGQADLVLGSRLAGKIASGAMPAHQRYGNWLAGLLIRVLYGQRLTDLSPMRTVRADAFIALARHARDDLWLAHRDDRQGHPAGLSRGRSPSQLSTTLEGPLRDQRHGQRHAPRSLLHI